MKTLLLVFSSTGLFALIAVACKVPWQIGAGVGAVVAAVLYLVKLHMIRPPSG